MADIVLFHSGLGLRPAILQWAELLRSDGHLVHTPDLYDGEVFDDLEAGVAKRDALGIPELTKRTQQAVSDLPAELVYAGFSLGAVSAEFLSATRPGARGAVLMHGAMPLAALGVQAWPQTVPVQIHGAERDPWIEKAAIESLAHDIDVLEVFRYPGSAHLFVDAWFHEYDADLADTMLQRVRRFVST